MFSFSLVKEKVPDCKKEFDKKLVLCFNYKNKNKFQK